MAVTATAQLPTMKLNLCQLKLPSPQTSLSRWESPTGAVPRARDIQRRIVREGSSISIPERGLVYIHMRERFRQSTTHRCKRSKSSIQCSARMLIIGNTTMMAPSTFSCSGSEKKYGLIGGSRFRCLGSHHGAFNHAPDFCTFRAK